MILSPPPNDARQSFYHYIQVLPKMPQDRTNFTRASLVVSARNFLPRQFWYREPDDKEKNGNEETWDFQWKLDDRSISAQTFDTQPPPGWRVEQVQKPGARQQSQSPATDAQDRRKQVRQGQESAAGKENPGERIEPGDRLFIEVPDALPDQPIKGVFRVEASGAIPFGFVYGRVVVKGLTAEQAEKRIREHLATMLKDPHVRAIWYDPVVHGSDASLDRRVHQLEGEVRELREAMGRLLKQRPQ
jgi:hypothetical protein